VRPVVGEGAVLFILLQLVLDTDAARSILLQLVVDTARCGTAHS
jgi:hypothetical protein